MASFVKLDNGRIKVVIRMQVRDGGPKAKTFSNATRARLWAAQREAELTDISDGQLPRKTLGEAFERYAREVSPTKRGGRWEAIRLQALPATGGQLMQESLSLQSVSPALLAQWRDRRTLEVSAGTVLRELGLLSAVFQRCVREWGWMRENPVRAIAKPASPAHRDKVLTRSEIRRVLRCLRDTGDISCRVGLAFLFALRTGMRAGEICGIKLEDIDGDSVILPKTKNGTTRRVPLSSKARKVLCRVLEYRLNPVFGLTPSRLDALFRKARDRAGLAGTGVVFHSTRHTAATMLAGKLSPYDLARMFGWKNLNEVMTYYNKTASDIAKILG